MEYHGDGLWATSFVDIGSLHDVLLELLRESESQRFNVDSL